MPKEPYEKPTITEIDIGTLLDEASRLLHRACNRLENSLNEVDRITPIVRGIEAEVAAAQEDIEGAKKAKLKIDAIIEMQR